MVTWSSKGEIRRTAGRGYPQHRDIPTPGRYADLIHDARAVASMRFQQSRAVVTPGKMRAELPAGLGSEISERSSGRRERYDSFFISQFTSGAVVANASPYQ